VLGAAAPSLVGHREDEGPRQVAGPFVGSELGQLVVMQPATARVRRYLLVAGTTTR
jgi:hypothetical protein